MQNRQIAHKPAAKLVDMTGWGLFGIGVAAVYCGLVAAGLTLAILFFGLLAAAIEGA